MAKITVKEFAGAWVGTAVPRQYDLIDTPQGILLKVVYLFNDKALGHRAFCLSVKLAEGDVHADWYKARYYCDEGLYKMLEPR